MTYAYPYDPTGSNPECLIRNNEEHAISTYYNKWRCIIPIYAPFYRKDLIVRHKETGRELREGLDYHLGHRFVGATTENKQMVYGSIFLEDLSLEGNIVFESYRTLGGSFIAPQSVILEYLATEFDDPRNCTWEQVVKHIPAVPPLHVPDDLPDAIETDPVTGALDKLVKAIGKSHDNVNAEYSKLDAQLTALEAKVDAYKIPEHILADGHLHQETYQQVGALGLTDTAKNTLLAYGRTLTELAALLNAMGVTQKDLDHYALKRGFTMEGLLRLDNGNAKIVNHNGTTVIDLASGDITIFTNKTFELNAERSKREQNIAGTLEAGSNMLSVHSTGTLQTKNRLVYNGAMVITVANIEEYVPPIPESMLAISHTDTASTKVRGTGRVNSPLQAEVKFVTYAPGRKGTVNITDSIFLNNEGVVASTKVTNKIYRDLATKVPQSLTINGKPLTEDIVLEALDLHLENVDDYSDVNMPLSQAFLDACAGKAAIDHKHNIGAILGTPKATESVQGVFLLSNDTTLSVKDRAAESTLFDPLSDTYEETEELLKEAMPSDAINVVHYGDFGYLPVPVTGSYPPTGSNSLGSGVQLQEADGTFVFLRNANGIAGKSVYYVTAKLHDNGTLTEVLPTPTVYNPVFIAKGQRVVEIYQAANDVMLLNGSDQAYIAKLNGTLDGSKHVGRACRLPDGYDPSACRMIVEDDAIYLVQSTTSMTFVVHRMAIENGIPVGGAFVEYNMAITDVYGTQHESSHILPFAGCGTSKSINDKPLFLNHAPEPWTIVTYDSNYTSMSVKEAKNKYRIRTTIRALYDDTNIMLEYMAQVVYDFDFEAGTAVSVIGHGEYPLQFAGNSGWTTTKATAPREWYLSDDGVYGRTNDNDVANTTVNNLVGFKPNGSKTMLEAMVSGDYTVTPLAALTGSYGSVIHYNPVGPALMPSHQMIVKSYGPTDYCLTKYTINTEAGPRRGYLPSLTRKSVPYDYYKTACRQIVEVDNYDLTMRGVVLTKKNLMTYSELYGETYSTPVDISQVAYDNLHTAARRALPGGIELIDSEIVIYVFPGRTMPCMTYMTYLHRNGSVVSAGVAVFRMNNVNLVKAGGALNIGNPTIGNLIYSDNTVFPTATNALGDHDVCTYYDCARTSTMQRDGNAIDLVMAITPTVPVPGWLYSTEVVLTYEESADRFTFHSCSAVNHTEPSGHMFLPGFNGLYALEPAFNKSVMKARNGSDSIVVCTPDVPSDFVLYLVNDMDYYVNKQMHTLKARAFDLKQLFPDSYKNFTFYAYVQVGDDGLPAYAIRKEFYRDDDHRTLIGSFKTDNNGIIEVNIQTVTRIGVSREMQEHFDDTHAHGYDNPSPAVVGLPNFVGNGGPALYLQNHQQVGIIPAANMGHFQPYPPELTPAKTITGINTGDVNLTSKCFRKCIIPATDNLRIFGLFDDEVVVLVNGKVRTHQLGYDMVSGSQDFKPITMNVPVIPGQTNEIYIVAINNVKPGTEKSRCAACFLIDDGMRYRYSDETWTVRPIAAHTPATIEQVLRDSSPVIDPYIANYDYAGQLEFSANLASVTEGHFDPAIPISFTPGTLVPEELCIVLKRKIRAQTTEIVWEGCLDDQGAIYLNGNLVKEITSSWTVSNRVVMSNLVPGEDYWISLYVQNTGGGPCYADFTCRDGNANYDSSSLWLTTSPLSLEQAKLAVVSPQWQDGGYVSARALRAMLDTSCYNGVLSGTIMNGRRLPVPTGYKRSQCTYLFTYHYAGDNSKTSNNNDSLDNITITITDDGIVTARTRPEGYTAGLPEDERPHFNWRNNIVLGYICIADSSK